MCDGQSRTGNRLNDRYGRGGGSGGTVGVVTGSQLVMRLEMGA